MCNEKDFTFIRIEEPYEDCWFRVSGETKQYLTSKYMTDGMIDVSQVVYSREEDIVGIKQRFSGDFCIMKSADKELKEVLKRLSLEVDYDS